MTEPDWLPDVMTEAGRLLGLAEPLVFSAVLVDLFSSGAEILSLAPGTIPDGRHATPEPEFGVLATAMPTYFTDYEFADYLPGAWPLALDGAGGFYCLDLRELVAGRSVNDGSAALVWSHAGNLGWGSDEMLPVSADAAAFVAAAMVD